MVAIVSRYNISTMIPARISSQVCLYRTIERGKFGFATCVENQYFKDPNLSH